MDIETMNEKQKAKTFFSPLVKEEVFDKLEEELLEVPRQMPLAPVSEEVIENVTELSKLQQDPKLVRVYDSSYLNRIFEGKKDVAYEVTRLFRASRAVISQNQELINNPNVGDKGLTAATVIAQALDNYKTSTGKDFNIDVL